jgi:hypothetical protein
MDRQTFIDEGKAKIDALFAHAPDHVSASILDIKRAFHTLMEHFTGDAVPEEPEPAELGDPAGSEPPAGTPLTPEELAANGLTPEGERAVEEPPVAEEAHVDTPPAPVEPEHPAPEPVV